MTIPNVSGTSAWSLFRRSGENGFESDDAQWLRLLYMNLESSALTSHDVHLAQELVRLDVARPTHLDLPMTLLLLTILADIRAGSTRTPVHGTQGQLHLRRAFLGLFHGIYTDAEHLVEQVDDWIAHLIPRVSEDGLSALVAHDETHHRPLVYRDGYLHEQKLLRREVDLVDRCIEMARDKKMSVSHGHASAESRLTDEQKRAVHNALGTRLSFVSGGPGTGKTSIVVALIEGFVAQGIQPKDIILAAPTGKAAWRMSQSIRAQLEFQNEADSITLDDLVAVTVHRLLGFHPRTGRFQFHKRAPIDARVVIVDEASMLDTVMAERLLNALGAGAHLIMLGDEDQLPSVSSGAIFKGMTKAWPSHAVHLTKNFRMRDDDPAGSQILRAASDVRAGTCRPEQWAGQSSTANLNFGLGGIDYLHIEPIDYHDFVLQWFQRFASLNDARARAIQASWPVRNDGNLPSSTILDDLFTYLESSQILSVKRQGVGSVDDVNRICHAAHARQIGVSADEKFVIGQPVIVCENDYHRSIFNGDFGVILRCDWAGSIQLALVLRTPEGFRAIPFEHIKTVVQHAYSITVHKSQGSEYERVAIVLPPEKTALLTRQLIYTAMTRARRAVVIMGSPDIYQSAVRNAAERDTTLVELARQRGDY